MITNEEHGVFRVELRAAKIRPTFVEHVGRERAEIGDDDVEPAARDRDAAYAFAERVLIVDVTEHALERPAEAPLVLPQVLDRRARDAQRCAARAVRP